MCGIAGFMGTGDKQTLERMTSVLAHRGPDGSGLYLNEMVGLGHQRLAVIDLTPTGKQPMSNEDGSLLVVYNGEIYNHESLREDLEARGHRFRGRSDTEVLLHLYEEYGRDFVAKLRGMFAFALWDGKRNELLLARDRVGQKPLVYAKVGPTFYFASEVKSLLEVPEVLPEIDPAMVHYCLGYKYVPWPYTMFRGIRKLPPATLMVVSPNGITTERYWTVDLNKKITLNEREAVKRLLALLEESVALRLISDVPVGALLSGGVDSSAVVALMRRYHSGPLKTFTVGYQDESLSDPEFPYAEWVAERYGTEHHALVIEPDCLDDLPRVLWHYDEPSAHPVALANYRLCTYIKDHVKVVLAGDGADELFGGYAGYSRWRYIYLASLLVNAIPGLAGLVNKIASRKNLHRAPLSMLHQFISLLTAEPRQWRSRRLMMGLTPAVSLYTKEFAEAMDKVPVGHLLDDLYTELAPEHFLDAILFIDLVLTNAHGTVMFSDISGMAHGVEIRAPFLDHEIVQFAASLPLSMKLRGFNQRKVLLKKMLEPYLPRELLYRRKVGYAEGVPFRQWFKGVWRERVAEILFGGPLQKLGLFDLSALEACWERNRKGERDHFELLWALTCLSVWYEPYS